MAIAMDKDDIARVRAIPLEAVLQHLGAARDPKDPAHNWRLGASRITVTDARFYDHNEAGALHRMRDGRAGGGGAIDLLQYLKDVGFREAVRELGGLDPRRTVAPVAKPINDRSAADTRPLPTPSPDRTARAHWYLTVVRRIPESIVAEELKGGRMFADARGNVVFRLRDEVGQEVGYEVRGTYEKPFHSVHGEKGMFITKADGTRSAAFVESGIEALSYRALRGRGLIVSTTGSAVERPASMARLLEARGYEIVTAFNADKSGDRMAARLQEVLGSEVRRDRPAGDRGKDWNEQLASRGTEERGVAASRDWALAPAPVR
jgi:uncharacterized protein DUF3991/Toprim domain-containing protein